MDTGERRGSHGRAWSYSFSRIHDTPSSLCPRGLLGSSATTAWKSGIAALTWPASASRMALSRRLVRSSPYDVPPTTCLVPTCSRGLASGAAHDIVSWAGWRRQGRATTRASTAGRRTARPTCKAPCRRNFEGCYSCSAPLPSQVRDQSSTVRDMPGYLIITPRIHATRIEGAPVALPRAGPQPSDPNTRGDPNTHVPCTLSRSCPHTD